MGGKGKGRGKEWMRKGRTSCWGGKKWILAQERESEQGESSDEKMMVKLTVLKEKK
jgi:hypothetical protein